MFGPKSGSPRLNSAGPWGGGEIRHGLTASQQDSDMNEKARLIIVDPSVGRTGAFVCAQNIARALNGRVPSLLVVPHGSQFSCDELRPFQGCTYLDLRSKNRALPAAFAWLVALVPSGIQLSHLLAKTNATHLVLNDFYLLQGFICRVLGFRGQIITWVRVEPHRAGGRFTGLLWLLIGLTSSRVVAVSHFVQRQIPSWLKPTILYDCLASSCDNSIRPISYGRFVYLGHLMPGKGQNYAVEAFAAIADHFPEAVLEFHGGTLNVQSNIEWREYLIQRSHSLGLNQRILFQGPYSDPFKPLCGAFAALNFSESETFSFTVLEALTAGVPVIATDCGGPSELVDHQETGVLVPVGQVAAMAHSMTQFLTNPEITASMGVSASRSIKQKFSMDVYREQLLQLLRI